MRIGKKSGFTLIETLAAVSILMIAVAGPMTLANRSLSSSIYAKEQLTASLLAQDLAEYVVASRGANTGKADTAWLGNLNQCTVDSPCGLDTLKGFDAGGNSQGLVHCSPPDFESCRLTFNSASGTYGHDQVMSGNGITSSLYVRTFALSSINDEEAQVLITVAWNQASIKRSIILRTSLFNLFKIT